MKLSAPIYTLKHKAKRMARAQQIPLNAALNHVAKTEGLASWSLLASQHQALKISDRLANALDPGDMVILSGRPLQGKTYLGLEVALKRAQAGEHAFFFTLEYHPGQVEAKCQEMGVHLDQVQGFVLDTSDDICADYICERLETSNTPAICIVDYLQLLDQKRSNPQLQIQLARLSAYARQTGCSFLFLSQIDRQFELSGWEMPLISDIRQPNPFGLEMFDKIFCLHNGGIHRMRD